MEICFILYKPAVPGNVGASARALKTMGFEQLRLINPCDHLSAEARMLAHGSNDILENAELFENFQSCIKDLDFLIGTTAKKRSAKVEYFNPAESKKLLTSKKDSIEKVGIVFGTEESGLPNEILQSCNIASTIPIENPYPSLNLGQSVMLYAYEFSMIEKEKAENITTNPEDSFIKLKKRVEDLLKDIDIPEDMPLYNRILERISQMKGSDINLLHSISSRLNEKLKN
jgi:tRNA/rRNA methyltransferase